MRSVVLTGACLAVLAGLLAADADARPRRPPKGVEHITFPSGYIEEKVAPYEGKYSRVILSNELVTRVTEGRPICRLSWEGHRVDALLEHTGPLEMIVAVPRGASLDGVDVYLVNANGKDAEEVSKPQVTQSGDSLIVDVPDVGDAKVVELKYRFSGEGISVDEAFLFQPELPVLKAEYKFSVSRELWQAAADEGLAWQFSATAEPRTWEPARDDSPDFFSWYWRDYSIEPLAAGEDRAPRSVSVTGYLPAPILAGVDPETLPNLDDLSDILDFTESLVTEFEATRVETPSSGGGGSLRDRYSGSEADVPSTPTKGGGR